MLCAFDWSNLISGLIGALFGALAGGFFTLWEAKVSRMHARMERAVGIYREIFDRRLKVLNVIRDTDRLQALLKEGDLSKRQEATKLYAEVVAGVDQQYQPIDDLWSTMMVCDSKGLRRSSCFKVIESLREIRDDLKNNTRADLPRHVAEEKVVFDVFAKCVNDLSELLPKLPQPDERIRWWLRWRGWG